MLDIFSCVHMHFVYSLRWNVWSSPLHILKSLCFHTTQFGEFFILLAQGFCQSYELCKFFSRYLSFQILNHERAKVSNVDEGQFIDFFFCGLYTFGIMPKNFLPNLKGFLLCSLLKVSQCSVLFLGICLVLSYILCKVWGLVDFFFFFAYWYPIVLTPFAEIASVLLSKSTGHIWVGLFLDLLLWSMLTVYSFASTTLPWSM